MALCLPLLVCAPACRRDAQAPPAPAPKQSVRATLAQVKGSVSVKRATGDEWQTAANGTTLYDDDKLRTERGGSAELHFPSGTVVVVSEDTLLGIAETRAAEHGDVRLGPANQSLTVGTPAATVRAGREIVFQ